ncbi:MAG: hypothetical protein ACR2HG_03985 [Pyrinomonadaceae bacterium]
MKKYTRAVQIIFAVPWLIFGVQHFLYADFVAGLVPAYFPLRHFWALFTGAAMIAAGLSFIFNRLALPAAVLLGVMLLIFILLIHVPTLASEPFGGTNLTRALQDIAIMSAAFMLARVLSKSDDGILKSVAKISLYLFALCLIAFGIEQFLNLDFLTAKVPDYFPLRIIWVYLTGVTMIAAGAMILFNKRARAAAILLGALMLALNLFQHVYILANDLHNAIAWTGAMLDLTLTCGAFILVLSLPEESLVEHKSDD